MRFRKYHALGNDYIVIDTQQPLELDGGTIRRICDRHRGVGSDGILCGSSDEDGAMSLHIYNPDGSEAEKSGNGIRIYARYLYDTGRVSTEPFDLHTVRSGKVRCEVQESGAQVKVEMGRVSFDAVMIPVAGMFGEVLNRSIEVGGRTLTFSAATIGNPHCIILCDDLSPALAQELGPQLETHIRFPRRTNVQFLKVIDDSHIAIEIWERGAGYTLASGTSSVAAAAVAHRLGLCGERIDVAMPGGHLSVELSPAFDATLRGPVRFVFDGEIND